jgi:hypothetical protein
MRGDVRRDKSMPTIGGLATSIFAAFGGQLTVELPPSAFDALEVPVNGEDAGHLLVAPDVADVADYFCHLPARHTPRDTQAGAMEYPDTGGAGRGVDGAIHCPHSLVGMVTAGDLWFGVTPFRGNSCAVSSSRSPALPA